MTTTTDLLPITEQAALERCEAIIARGVQTFIDVGEALAEIRDARLYRTHYDTWEEYCTDRWGIGGSRARQLIGASSVARHIESVTTVTLSNEAQARPLVGLAPEQQVAAAQRATAIAGSGAPTAKHFQQAAVEVSAPAAPYTGETRDADGPWFKASKSANHPTAHHWNVTPSPHSGHYLAACGIASAVLPTTGADAGLCSVCAKHGDRRELVPIPVPMPAAPDLPDILLRLDAHGYAKTTTRQKGIATLYCFRDYSGRSDDTGGEIEMAEGELPIWLAELDSHAAYAQAKQERFIDAQDRAERLGYDLRRDGTQFALTPAGQQAPALRGTLDQLIKTIEGYERNAAKQAAPAPDPMPRPASATVAAYEAQAARDAGRLGRAQSFLAAGEHDAARTVLSGIEVSTHARDVMLAEIGRIEAAQKVPIPAGCRVEIELTVDDCAALLKEARVFASGDLTKKLPAIGQVLILLIEAIKG